MNRILIVIPTFKIKNGVPDFLKRTLLSIFKQKVDYFIDVVISDTLSPYLLDDLVYFIKSVKYCCLINDNVFVECVHYEDHLTVFQAFNTAVKYAIQKQKYDYIIYCSDDTELPSSADIYDILSVFKNENVAVVSGKLNRDHSGPNPTCKYNDINSPVKIRLGENVNLHFIVFSNYFMQKYDYKYPDIMGSYGTEGLFTFLCAAINKEWWVTAEDLVNLHFPAKHKGIVGHSICKNFKTFREIFEPGIKFGLGFECWRKFANDYHQSDTEYWSDYDKSCYDSDEKCLYADELYSYMKENLFLPKNIFDYDEALFKAEIRKYI